MRNIWAIARRELYAYFSSPIAYITMAAFLAVQGIIYLIVLLIVRESVMSIVLGNVFTLLFLILYAAVVTMRLLAEEQRSGTIELVLTAPVRDWELVVGKYLAAVILFLATVVITLYQPFIMARLGDLDLGTTASNFLGFVLVGVALLALGTLTSTVTRNQVVAAILTIAIGLPLWLIEFFGSGSVGPSGGSILDRLAFFVHFHDFRLGIIDTEHIVYYLSLVAASLFLATRALEARKWR